jgi:hypothetical protein
MAFWNAWMTTLRGPRCPFVTVAVTALLSGKPKSRNQPSGASRALVMYRQK